MQTHRIIRMKTHKNLIAPCGMNCSVCSGFLRTKNKCVGCRITGSKPGYCTRCIIINCSRLAATKSGFCYDCDEYPCKRMKQLDKRYRLKYSTSLLGNLEHIKTNGLDEFVRSEAGKWRCSACGGTICIHTKHCVSCN